MRLDEMLNDETSCEADDDVDGSQAELGMGMHLEAFLKGNDTVLRHFSAERVAAGLVVSPMARRAIEQEVLPQLDASVTSVAAVSDLLSSAKAEIEDAFKGKTTTYTRLVSYKSIDQSDTQFLEDLLRVLDEWAVRTKSTLADGDEGDDDEVKLKIHVDNEIAVTVDDADSPVSVEVDTKTASEDETEDDDVSLPSSEEFDLNEMRL